MVWLIAAALLIGAANLLILIVQLPRLSRRAQEAAERGVREELRAARAESQQAAQNLRTEVSTALNATSQSLVNSVGEIGKILQAEVATSRSAVDTQLKSIQEGNEKKLDEMRQTVDDKLQETLNKRLGESFKLVSDQLEAVHRGLGEMQGLATGVGDLKRVLTNVKVRGTWAEYQLGAILEQILTPDQFDRNVRVREEGREAVEFAVRLPGPDGDRTRPIWLPIDSKFPREDYDRLVAAAEAGDTDGVGAAAAALTRAIRTAAQDIRVKYIHPPRTTDFAILFLPTEGLYAELLRQPGLVDQLQQGCRVVVAGPTTLAAILSSLRMGFRTLAIEQRASEVWSVLGAVKTEFGKFGEVLDRVKRQLSTAASSIDDTSVRTRVMERKLRQVEQLPQDDAERLLALHDVVDSESPEKEPLTEPLEEPRGAAPGRPADGGMADASHGVT